MQDLAHCKHHHSLMRDQTQRTSPPGSDSGDACTVCAVVKGVGVGAVVLLRQLFLVQHVLQEL